MRYETRDGEVYAGATAEEVVAAMAASSAMTDGETTAKYMMEAGARFARFENVIVRTDTAENFVADLVAGGVLREVK